ncbi:nucleotide sugar dehydrogenase [Alphaproteobacteria bacterium]|nr:nucleotide sugar dehydrogenase [Alphaproteobacteria bacterium]
MKSRVIGFAGMSHLGINSAVAAAARGFDVLAFDYNQSLVQEISQGRFPIYEVGLSELAKENASRLSYTSDLAELSDVDLCYVSLDVLTDDAGRSDLGPIRFLIDELDMTLRADTVMVVLSQVPPGFSRLLNRRGELLFYQVETLVFGQAVERALNPERFIVGCDNPDVPLPEIYETFLNGLNCPVLRMRYESAELAKIAINIFLVSSISASNSLAEICEKVGADWSEIVPALRLDRRIGRHAYLTPGLGIGGGNLERDLATVRELADCHKTDAGVVEAWIANSAHRRDWVKLKLQGTILKSEPAATLAVLGLAYKQDTASTKNSPALSLLAALPACQVTVYDPMVRADPAWHPNLSVAADPIAACLGADALVVMTPWSEFSDLSVKEIADAMSGLLVIDPYGILDGSACASYQLDYHRLGEGAPPAR